MEHTGKRQRSASYDSRKFSHSQQDLRVAKGGRRRRGIINRTFFARQVALRTHPQCRSLQLEPFNFGFRLFKDALSSKCSRANGTQSANSPRALRGANASVQLEIAAMASGWRKKWKTFDVADTLHRVQASLLPFNAVLSGG